MQFLFSGRVARKENHGAYDFHWLPAIYNGLKTANLLHIANTRATSAAEKTLQSKFNWRISCTIRLRHKVQESTIKVCFSTVIKKHIFRKVVVDFSL